MKSLFRLVFALCLFVAAVAGCKKDKEPGPVVESEPAEKLLRILDDSLKQKGFGYSFSVFRNGKLVGSSGGGFAARALEAGRDKWLGADTKMQIASMTKTITAAAFLQLAGQKGIKTTDKIIDYLPKYWRKGPNIGLITFRDLLTHQSGIIGLGDNCRNGAYTENVWDGLKALIEKGIKKENYGNSCYQNANFGLFRVLIPAMNGLVYTGNDQVDESDASDAYERYIWINILQKAGLKDFDFLSNAVPVPTYGYDFPYSGEYGFDPGNFKSTTGGYGFYLSAVEAVKLYATLFSPDNNALITNEMRGEIVNSGLGSYSAVMPEGKFTYHDGWWQIGVGGPHPKGFRSVWMHCPDNITIVLFTNALRSGDGLFPIRSAFYDDITSYLLWAFNKYKNPGRGGRSEAVNFHRYLAHPEPH